MHGDLSSDSPKLTFHCETTFSFFFPLICHGNTLNINRQEHHFLQDLRTSNERITFKNVLACSVPSSKRLGFDTIEVFREIERDQHSFHHFLSKFADLKIDSQSWFKISKGSFYSNDVPSNKKPGFDKN